MAAVDHHPSRQDLEAYALGRLDDVSFADVEEHISDCSSCQQLITEVPGDTFTELLRSARSLSETIRDQDVGSLTAIEEMSRPSAAATGSWGVDGKTGLPEPPPALAGHPRYQLVRLLGFGGMGSVWLAEHRVMGRMVAVKAIRPEFLARPGAAERFRREAQAAARLHHPNIVAAYDAEQAGDVHLLAMEYVDGINLADYLHQRGPLPIHEACDFVRQVALGLKHAYENGLIHRDLKPHNLMRTADGTVKILDFGLSALADASQGSGLTGENMVVGTPDYIAPEQAEDARRADIRSDIYSLGCTLYQLLTGRVPFPGDSVLKKLDAHRTQEATPVTRLRPDVPAGLAAVLARMMVKVPSERYQTPAEVAAALEPWSTGEWGCVSAPSTPGANAAGLVERTRRRLVAVALMFAGLIAVAGVVFYIVTDNGTIEIRTEDENVKVVAERNGQQITILDPKSKQTWLVDTGKYTVRLDGAPEGLEIEMPQTFTLKRGDKQVITVKRVHGPVIAVKPPDKGEREAAVQKALRELEGTWHLVSFQGDGREIRGEDRTRTWTFQGDRLEARVSGNLQQSATVKVIDPTAVPRKADLGGCKGDEKNKSTAAIYKIEGDTLHWCHSYDGAPRPTEFRTAKDSGLNYYIWNRVPPEKSGIVRHYEWPNQQKDPAQTFVTAFSADGRLHAAASDGGLVRVWEVATGKQRLEVNRPGTRFHSIAFTADGAHLLVGYGDRRLDVLDVTTGKEVRRFERQLFEPVPLPSGKAVISAEADDNVVRVVELSTGKELTRLDGVRMSGLFAFTPDGKQVAGRADTQIRLWDVTTGQVIRRFDNQSKADVLNFSPDGKQLLLSDHVVLRLWDVETGRELRSFHGHTSPIISASFLPGGRIASYSYHHKVLRVWDPETGKQLQSHDLAITPLTPKRPLTLTPDGRLYLTNHTNNSILVRDMATGHELLRFTLKSNPQTIAVSPDGRYASCGRDHDGVYLFCLP